MFSGADPVVMVVGHRLDPALAPLLAVAEVRVCADSDSIHATLPEADVMLVWDYDLLPLLRHAWRQAGRLRWIQTSGIGVDAVLGGLNGRPDVLVTNARGIFEDAVAEYALALLLALAKEVPVTLRDQTQQRWAPREVMLLRDRSALVLGAGAIGRRIARLLQQLGMSTTVIARRDRHDDELGHVHALDDLDELLQDADAVVCALPLTPATDGLLDRARISQIRPGSVLVNVARGALVDEVALAAAVAEGRLQGVALDVFDQEPLPAESPLWTLGSSLVVSPNMASEMRGWQAAVARRFVENLECWRREATLIGVVDLERAGVTAT